MSDALYLAGALVAALLGILFLRATVDLLVRGERRLPLMRSVGHGVTPYVKGQLPARDGASGWRVTDGWHSKVDTNGGVRFASHSRVSDEAV